MNAPGSTTLNGAEVNGKRIDVHTGQLSITSPQNTSDYKSSSSQISAGVTVGTSPTDNNLSGGYTKQTITDHFATTGKTLSGLYSGSDGIGIDVSGDTTLKAGVISSTADASKNHLTTTHLDASDVENSSVWKMTSVGGQGSIGAGMVGSSMEQLGQFAKNMAANSLGMLGGGRSHDEHSTSQSAISGNITVQAQSQSGHYTTDVSSANAALDNKFDPQKLRNQMQSARVGAQLVGETIGSMAQQFSYAGIPGFSETDLKDSWARTLLEGGANAGIAALTGGNIGAAAAGSVLGNVAATASRGVVGDLARAITGDTGDGTQSLANAMSSVIAGGAGAVGGLVAGGGNSGLNALNGAAAASALEQYNAQEHMTVYGHRKKSTVPVSKETVHTMLDIASATPIPLVETLASLVLVGMDVYDGNYGEAALDGLGLIPIAGAAVKDVVVARKAAKFAEKVEKANELRKEEEQARDAEKAANREEKKLINTTENIKIYRALSPEEFYSIMKDKQFSLKAGAYEAKQFSFSEKEILKYVDSPLGKQYAAIVEASLPKAALEHTSFDISHTIDEHIFKSGVLTVDGQKGIDFLNSVVHSIQHIH